jgi:hypothetical protein
LVSDGQSFSVDSFNPDSKDGVVLWSGDGLDFNHVFRLVITHDDNDGKALEFQQINFTPDEG